MCTNKVSPCPQCREYSDSQYDPGLRASAHIYMQIALSKTKRQIRALRTVQFDPESGIQRTFFNGKLEGISHVRSTSKRNTDNGNQEQIPNP